MLFNRYESGNPEIMLQMMTHTGKGWNSGFRHVDVELAYTFDSEQLHIDQTNKLIDFIAAHVATDYIEHEFYNSKFCKAWCKLENYDPEQWEKDFLKYQDTEREESIKNRRQGTQLSLF